MEREGTFDTRIKAKQEILEDLKLCLSGSPASKRWQKLSNEAKDLENTIKCLIQKQDNNIPNETREYKRFPY